MNGRTVVCERAPTRQGGEVHVAASLISSIDSVVVPGSRELDHEAGVNRGLLTDIRTMRAVDLCDEQGIRASRGFLDLFRG